MLWSKLIRIIFIFKLLILSQTLWAAFTDMECINSAFESVVSHKGQPFGLTNTKLKVSKENCLITIEHNELKYVNKKWEVDVCREPIHIKTGVGAIEVLKKKGSCKSPQANKEYCEAVQKIELILQDDGLIFAEGEKEDLKTDHGRLYCSFLLLKAYLRNNVVYSRHREYKDTLIKSNFVNKEETCDVTNSKEASVEEKIDHTQKEVPVPMTEPVNSSQQIVAPTNGNTIPESNEQGRF